MGRPGVHALPLMSNLDGSMGKRGKPPQRLRACQKQKQLVPHSLNGAWDSHPCHVSLSLSGTAAAKQRQLYGMFSLEESLDVLPAPS